METQNEKLREACNDAFLCFQKIGDTNYSEIQSKLQFVIGSYDYDKNPVGLYEVGKVSLEKLKELKEVYPRKVNKQVISGLEKTLQVN